MGDSIHRALRARLRACDDGATVRELTDATGIARSAICRALQAMPDAYIDRWQPLKSGTVAAVWCVVPVPEHCPRPEALA